MCRHNDRKATPTIGLKFDGGKPEDAFDTENWMCLRDAILLRASLDKAIKYVQAKKRTKKGAK